MVGKPTCGFSYNLFVGDKKYKECIVEFKINGDNFVNYSKKTTETVGLSVWIISKEQTDRNK